MKGAASPLCDVSWQLVTKKRRGPVGVSPWLESVLGILFGRSVELIF